LQHRDGGICLFVESGAREGNKLRPPSGHLAELNDSGSLWRMGKSLEAFALKVASQWQTTFFFMLQRSA